MSGDDLEELEDRIHTQFMRPEERDEYLAKRLQQRLVVRQARAELEKLSYRTAADIELIKLLVSEKVVDIVTRLLNAGNMEFEEKRAIIKKIEAEIRGMDIQQMLEKVNAEHTIDRIRAQSKR